MTTLCDPKSIIAGDTAPSAVGVILGEAAPASPSAAMKAIASPTRIVLTGFMGAGKSTVGTLLAERLGWRFFDVDDEVVARAGMPVQRIFAQSGEFAFRRLETSAVAHLLGERDAVIALGGGAVEVLANRLLLEQTPDTAVVWLDAPLPALLARCQVQVEGPVRPNLPVAEERFQYRLPLYRRVATLRIQTEAQTPALTTAEIARALNVSRESR